jgi:lysophospholipase L1-like esterase
MLRTKKNIVILVFTILIVVTVGSELFARFVLGLGTPPLLISHPRIEYMFKPDQDVYRFHNHIVVNQYGMRSEPFPANRQEAEIRIMVFGDSIINGGSVTDHEDLATSLLKTRLQNELDEQVVVGNISAGSWGPGNWLAYAKEFGFFDADILILVVSSHDFADNPTFEPLDNNIYPTEKPLFAFLEGVSRYLPRYFPGRRDLSESAEVNLTSSNIREQDAQKGLGDLRDFLELGLTQVETVIVFQYWDEEEIANGSAKEGYYKIKSTCEDVGLTPISLASYFIETIQNDEDPFRDNIHPNELGQRLISEVIFQYLPALVHK